MIGGNSMDETRDKMLKEVMAAGFSAYDLHLYLNTHPYDKKALYFFNFFTQKSRILSQNFERIYGPLTAATSYGYPWQWINSPWPWENS
jgi:spore coat protein JB